MVTGIGRPGKKQVCEGKPRVRPWSFKFELLKVRLNGKLDANIRIPRENGPRDASRESPMHRRIQAAGQAEITEEMTAVFP